MTGRRWALRCYPPAFRERYGAELEQLVADAGASNPNLLWGAAQAWMHPVFAGELAERRRRRLQATVGTVWVAWCAAFFVTPALNRLLLDPPPPDQSGTVPMLLRAAEIIWLIGCGFAAWAALVMTIRTALPTLRSGRRAALRPLLAAGAAVLAEAAGLALLAVLRGPVTGGSLPIAFAVLGLVWTLGLGPTVLLVALGPVRVLCRLAPTEGDLRRALDRPGCGDRTGLVLPAGPGRGGHVGRRAAGHGRRHVRTDLRDGRTDQRETHGRAPRGLTVRRGSCELGVTTTHAGLRLTTRSRARHCTGRGSTTQ